MSEVAHSSEDHREPELVGRFDHFVVAQRAARLAIAVAPASAASVGPSGNGNSASDTSTEPASGTLSRAAFSRAACTGSIREVAPPPTANVRIVGDECDRVGLDMLADLDSERERAHLGVGGARRVTTLPFGRILM